MRVRDRAAAVAWASGVLGGIYEPEYGTSRCSHAVVREREMGGGLEIGEYGWNSRRAVCGERTLSPDVCCAACDLPISVFII